MPKKKKKKNEPARPTPILDHEALAHNPFAGLKGLKIEEDSPPTPGPDPEPRPRQEDGEGLFALAMDGVKPLEKGTGLSAKGPARVSLGPSPAELDDLETLAYLTELVQGRAAFDIIHTSEYIEGYVKGFHPVVLEKLRQGRFAVQAYLDLHGLTAREAEAAVKDFLAESVSLGYRCVLLVHGRGLNSKDQIPVLKQRLQDLLLKRSPRRHILAFTSARPHDGGAGASYVLLRAKRG